MLITRLQKDYFYTYLTYGISFVSTLAIYYFLSQRFANVEFEKYNLSRRVIGITSVLLMLGVAVSLPKSVAILKITSDSSIYKVANLFSTLIFVLMLGMLFTLSVFSFPKFYGELFWNTSKYNFLIEVISIFVVSTLFFNIVFSFSRGLMDMTLANTMTLCNAIIPLLLLPNFVKIEVFYLTYAGLNFLTAALFLYIIFRKNCLKLFFSFKFFKRQLYRILKFGIPRVPGDFALEGILSIPVFITAHTINTQDASNLGFAISLISMIGTFISPVSIILLPYSAQLMMQNNLNELKKHIRIIFLFFLPIIFIITFILFFFSEPLIEIVFRKLNSDVSFYIKMISGVLLPYTVFLIVRSVNDIFYTNAVNAINTIFSFVVLLISAIFFCEYEIFKFPAIASLYISIFFLGGSSYYTYIKIYKR
jgi:O-antigen/teichoic acid export membrane protein